MKATIKNILNLIDKSDKSKVLIDNKFDHKNLWYFTNESNRFIRHNMAIEVSANKYGWPNSCIVKKDNLPKVVFSSKKISFLEKIKFSFRLRDFTKSLRENNYVGAVVIPAPMENYIVRHDFIEYEE